VSEETTLIALRCVQCDTPLPAQPGEIAWACGHCGTGQMLDLNTGLVRQQIFYHAELKPGTPGRPFWVVPGKVSVSRDTYGFGGGDGAAKRFWATERRFFIPAYKVGVDELVDTVTRWLQSPPALSEGAAEAFRPVVVSQEDLQALAEYVVLGIEAQRRDDVKQVGVTVKLGAPELWVLP